MQTKILDGKLKFYNSKLAIEMPRIDAEKLKAPKGEGIHDDTVMACAIAAHGFSLFHQRRR